MNYDLAVVGQLLTNAALFGLVGVTISRRIYSSHMQGVSPGCYVLAFLNFILAIATAWRQLL